MTNGAAHTERRLTSTPLPEAKSKKVVSMATGTTAMMKLAGKVTILSDIYNKKMLREINLFHYFVRYAIEVILFYVRKVCTLSMLEELTNGISSNQETKERQPAHVRIIHLGVVIK